MSSVPNSYIDDLRSIVLATLNRIEQLRMRVLFGVQVINGAYDQTLEFRADGFTYSNGVKIESGSGDFMADGSVPMTGALDMNDNNLANCNTVNGRIDSILQITSNYQTLRLNADTGYDIVMGDPVAMGANKITGLGTPTSDYDGATKKYVDDNVGGVTDHGALTGLGDDDHAHYYNSARHTKAVHDALNIDADTLDGLNSLDFIKKNGSVAMTGDLTIHKVNPNVILYPTTTDSPRLQLKDNSNNLKSSIYQNTDDMAIVCEDGDLYLATVVTTGGDIKIESKAVTQLTISSTALTSTVPMTLGGNLTFSGASPSVYFDTGDALYYDKTNNFLNILIGAANEYTFTTAALNLNGNNISDANIIQAKSTNDLTFKVTSGKSIIFQTV